jgi:hypothetical protein
VESPSSGLVCIRVISHRVTCEQQNDRRNFLSKHVMLDLHGAISLRHVPSVQGGLTGALCRPSSRAVPSTTYIVWPLRSKWPVTHAESTPSFGLPWLKATACDALLGLSSSSLGLIANTWLAKCARSKGQLTWRGSAWSLARKRCHSTSARQHAKQWPSYALSPPPRTCEL